MTDAPDATGLDDIFMLDPDAWAPRKTLFHIAYGYFADRGDTTLTPQRLYRLLRDRGFRESTRNGVVGFKGFTVTPEAAARPRLVPEHSASSYKRGDRSPEAKRARRLTQSRRESAELDALYYEKPLSIGDHRVDDLTPPNLRRAAHNERLEREARDEAAAARKDASREAHQLEAILALYGPESRWPLDLHAKLRNLRERAGQPIGATTATHPEYPGEPEPAANSAA